jgi:hypothetical protein
MEAFLIKIDVMGETYFLLKSKFMVRKYKNVEDIGLADLDAVPYIMENINTSVRNYTSTMWRNIIDVYLLLKCFGYRRMRNWERQAVKYFDDLNAYLNGSDMSAEKNRLKTFKDWPHQYVCIDILAKTGFYVSGPRNDQVKCYFCDVEIAGWDAGDDEIGEHLRWSPNCSLLNHRITENRPISVSEMDSVLPSSLCEYKYEVGPGNTMKID